MASSKLIRRFLNTSFKYLKDVPKELSVNEPKSEDKSETKCEKTEEKSGPVKVRDYRDNYEAIETPCPEKEDSKKEKKEKQSNKNVEDNKKGYIKKTEERILNCKKWKLTKYIFFPPCRVNVSIQGANTKAGTMAALLLKNNPLMKKIYLYDTKPLHGIEADLNNIDTSSKVKAYHGEDKIELSLRAADIVVIVDTHDNHENKAKKFQKSFKRVKTIAENCVNYCPRAVVIVCVEPLCCMLPLVQKVYEETPFFHPSKLVGNITHLQSIVNNTAADYLNLSANSIHIPLAGGPCVNTIVPLVSQMNPDPGLMISDQKQFYDHIKKVIKQKYVGLMPNVSNCNSGHSIAKIVTAIAKGLCGHTDARSSVFARSNCIPQVRYIATTVQFGLNGIYTNYGLPKFTYFEMEQLLSAITTIKDSDRTVEDAYENLSKSRNLCAN